jgi:hypothetical protein
MKKHPLVLKSLVLLSKLTLILLGIAILYVIGSFIFAISGEGELISTYPVDITFENAELKHYTSYDFIRSKGYIKFSSEHWSYYLLKIIDSILKIGLIFWVTLIAHRLFKRVEAGEIFSARNVKKLQQLSLLVFFVFLYEIIEYAVYALYIKAHSANDTQVIQPYLWKDADKQVLGYLIPDLNFSILIISLILWVISEVFRKGHYLETENKAFI